MIKLTQSSISTSECFVIFETKLVDHGEDLLLFASLDFEQWWHIVIHINIKGMLTYDVA
jgi:hypothetical protein